MNDSTLFKGMVLRMEEMGAEYVKCDGIDIFFNIPKSSEINDREKLLKAKNAFFNYFGYTLKVRYI